MKYLILSGGLGNQMFQYAYLLSLRHKGVDVGVDTSLYNYTVMHNGFELPNVFGIEEEQYGGSRINIFWFRFLLKFRPKIFLAEETFDAPLKLENIKCYIKGEFQSEDYFKEIEEVIRKTYSFRNVSEANIRIASKLNSLNSISVHIRRGDYVKHPLYEGICTEKYYQQAIEKMLGKVPECKFFVFSNDACWSNTFFENNFRGVMYEIIDINRGADSFQDMFLMSQCKHNIIANSSFSWWGAWLNSNREKIVIAPQKWMNTSEEKYKSIIPKSWMKI